ncbi:MAG TPA: hypothetical protein VFA05_08225 [Gaiellaceae bacterium]|nr:hypothetical protein [Gaiellaceae bacterium]
MKLVAAVAAALAVVPAASAAPKPVPSLTPTATHRLWLAEVKRARLRPRNLADLACRPARVVFYAQSDWLRLATYLAQSASPCAQYYVSVPPLAGDKTQPRAGQAAQIRALGPNFHALDEINYTGWSNWVAAGNGSWHDAGELARRRMAAAGFDTGAGDTWALNELSSAVRAGTGSARANAEAFLAGLGGDGVKGVVFATGIAQSTDPTQYKVTLQSWLQDAGFWGAIAPYVSDFEQEDYGDVRDYAAAGTTPQQRRDALGQYLEHLETLANVAPAPAAAARDVLDATYGPLANAAWAWSSAYGWTAVDAATMQDYVSAEVYAARAASASAPSDRFGFAWAPDNTLGLSSDDFAAQTAAILARLATAIQASGAPNADPGSPACTPTWCTATLGGAALTSAWSTFGTWSVSTLAFANAPATFAAGAVAGPLTVELQTAGLAAAALSDQTVTLSTSSARGGFSTNAAGPWTPTLTLTMPAGASSASFYYADTAAGTAAISAALAGQPAVAQAETVTPAALATLAVAPAAATVAAGKSVTLTASGVDAYGNTVAVQPTWTLSAPLGRLTATTGASTTFVAGATAGPATVTAVSGSVSATAALTVAKPPPRLAHVGVRMVAGHVVASATVVAGGAPAPGVAVRLRVLRSGRTLAVATGRTDARGTFTWRSRRRLPRAHYAARAALRSASTA